MKKLIISLGSGKLTPEDVGLIAGRRATCALTPAVRKKMVTNQRVMRLIMADSRTIYGVTTGFGRLSDVRLKPREIEQLQQNLVRSHATGVGLPFSPEETRAIMLLQANKLAQAVSGVRPVVVELLAEMVNRNVVPIVPRQGSVGASGDLAPMSHVALVMIGEGVALVGGKVLPGRKALAQAGLKPLVFRAREGLAVTNGTEVMTAVGTLALLKAERLARVADVAGVMTLEALRDTPSAFDARIHELRPHLGQAAAAANMRALMEDSEIRKSHLRCAKLQDAYSLRCMPQVHGAARNALAHARDVLQIELNSVTDNPVVISADRAVLSGGNFHGEPVALVMDYLAIAVAELGSISERRIARLLDSSLSGLPPFLTARAGVNSGYMMVQSTAASLVSENKVLCHPASVDSIPTSANQEDHVSMGTIAARKAVQVCTNVQYTIACELLCAAQGLEFQCPLKPGRGAFAVYREIRRSVPPGRGDRAWHLDINAIFGLIESGVIPGVVKKEGVRLL